MSGIEQQDIKQIKALVTTGYMSAVHAGDPQRYAALFTENSLWMPPQSDPVFGRAAIEEGERKIFESVALEVVSRVLEANVSGDIGWALGEIDGTAVPHDRSESSLFHLRLMWVVQRESGSWKIHRQIWNARPAI